MTRKQRFRAVIAIFVATAGLFAVGSVPGAGAATHPTYPLAKAKSCRVNYHKRVLEKIVTVRVKVHGKWKIEHRREQYVACVYEAPVRIVVTTTTIPTTTTTTTSTTTTTIPAPQTFGTNVSVEATESDIPCGDYYCYSLYATISDIGWPSPKDPPVDLGTVTFSSGAGSTSVNIVWDGFGQVTASASMGVPRNSEVTATYSGGSYIGATGGEVTIQSAFGSTTVTSM
jgi:hypothetical protein